MICVKRTLVAEFINNLKLCAMKYKKRRFIPGECMHVYQREVKGYNIFYDREDFLVFYMIFSVLARLAGIKVQMLCLMPNHVHILLSADSMEVISRFIMHYTSVFVREYNDDVGRKGALFHKSFGSAPKKGGKAIRSTIVYIGNNPVEKDLSAAAEEYQWNFLKYISMKINGKRVPVRSLSLRLQKAFKIVDRVASRPAYFNYAQLRRLMRGLEPNEVELLTDHIIMTYFPFDVDSLLGFYDSYEDMLTAMRSTAGKEFDIKEQYYPETDTAYKAMSDTLEKDFGDVFAGQVRKVTVLPPGEKFRLAQHLRRCTSASIYQISRFLHLPVARTSDATD